MIKYQTDPIKIREKYSKVIRKQLSLGHFSELEQRIVIQIIQAAGDISILENLRFSESAAEIGLQSIKDDFDLLCDSRTVSCAVKQKYLKDEPICLISKANVISQAKAKKHTRSMTAIDLWKPYLAGSIVLIGEEPTALFRLLEILEKIENGDSDKKPALIIAMPGGFIGAVEAKDYLWKNQQKIGVPCITLLGEKGGSNLSAAVINSLLRIYDIDKKAAKK